MYISKVYKITYTTHPSGALYSDLPYGFNLFPDDTSPTLLQLQKRLKQFNAINQSDSYVVVNWHTPKDTQTVIDSMKELHISHHDHVFWHKKDHVNFASHTSQLVSSCEMATIGYYPDKLKVPFLDSDKDPKLRHNFIDCPSVKVLAKGPNNQPINVTEKPWQLSYWLLKRFCRPASWVLIIGAGAGGDIVGAIRAGMNVVAVEKDRVQYDALKLHLTKILSQYTNLADKGKLLKDADDGDSPAAEGAQTSADPVGDIIAGLSQGTLVSPNKKKNVPKCVICGLIMAKDIETEVCCKCDDAQPCHIDCLNKIQGEGDDAEVRYMCDTCQEEHDDVPETQVT